MPAAAQLRGIGGLQQINDAGHGVHRVAPQLRAGAMRRFAPRLQLHPQRPFVRRHHLQARRFAHNRQVGPEATGHQGARTRLAVLLIHQPGEDDLRVRRPRPVLRQLAQRRQHGRHRTLGVAGAPAKQTSARVWPA